jgi:inhibitor of KinA
MPYDVMCRHVSEALNSVADANDSDGVQVEIPVCYGGEFGPDLDYVASHAGMSTHEVIERHMRPLYRVHLIGFLPGFPYLGGLDPRLATPRRDTPRTAVPAGSVGIGGMQTGVYPLESPGGWHLIGRSPAVIFDSTRTPPTRLAPGDVVRFRAIEPGEFALMHQAST